MEKLPSVIRTILLVSLLSFTQCKRDKPSLPAENLSWNIFLQESIESLKYIKPRWASADGEYQFDSLVQIPCHGQRNRDRMLCHSIQEKIKGWPTIKLSTAQQHQQLLLLEVIRKIVFELEINRSHEHDPVLWEIPETLITCLGRSQVPLEQRLVRMEILTEIFLLYTEKRQLDLSYIDSSAVLTAQRCIAASKQILLDRLPDLLQKSNLPPADCGRINQKAVALVNRLSEFDDFLLSQNTSAHPSTDILPLTYSEIKLSLPHGENEGRKSFSALIHSLN